MFKSPQIRAQLVVRMLSEKDLNIIAEIMSRDRGFAELLLGVFGAFLPYGDGVAVPVLRGTHPTFVVFRQRAGGTGWRYASAEEEDDIALAMSRAGMDPTPLVRVCPGRTTHPHF